MATIGARYGSGGSRSGPIRVFSSARSARFSDRYPARNTTRITLRSSDGWPESGPIERLSRAPLVSEPNTKTSSRSAIPAAAHVYLYVRSQASERTARASTVTTASATSSQPSCSWPRPYSVPPNDWVTRSWGSRCIRSSPRPPSIATAGSSTWSVRRPDEDERDVDGEQGAEIHEQALGIGRQEVERRVLPA